MVKNSQYSKHNYRSHEAKLQTILDQMIYKTAFETNGWKRIPTVSDNLNLDKISIENIELTHTKCRHDRVSVRDISKIFEVCLRLCCWLQIRYYILN